jgi:hypothetical protein
MTSEHKKRDRPPAAGQEGRAQELARRPVRDTIYEPFPSHFYGGAKT